MPTPCIKFHVLNVGVGSGNFIEVFEDKDDTSKPSTTLLIDLGCQGINKESPGPSVEFVVDRLKTMGNDAEIDCLILTHSDLDHVSLIKQLLDQFDTDELVIKDTFFGGAAQKYKKNKTQILDLVAQHMPDDELPDGHAIAFSSYKDPKKPVAIYKHSTLDLRMYVLMANALQPNATSLPTGKNAVALNTVSYVVVVEFYGERYLVTGDATGTTMLQSNKIMRKGDDPFFDSMVMVTVPHHGSLVTAEDVKGVDGKTNAVEFAKRVNGETLTVSSYRKHNHPSARLLSWFWQFTKNVPSWLDSDATVGHFYVAFFTADDNFELDKDNTDTAWPADGDGFYTAQTSVLTYGTDYFSAANLQAFEDDLKLKKGATKKVLVKRERTAVFPTNTDSPPAVGQLVDYPTNNPIAGRGWTYTTTKGDGTKLAPLDPTDTLSALRADIIERSGAGLPTRIRDRPTPSRKSRDSARPPPSNSPTFRHRR